MSRSTISVRQKRLTSDAVKLVSFEHQLFFDTLHGVIGAQEGVLHQVDLAERPSANYLNDVEVCLLYRRVSALCFRTFRR